MASCTSDLIAPKLLAQQGLATLDCTVCLEHVLRQIDANRRNLHGGRPFRFEWLLTHPLWHRHASKVGASIPLLTESAVRRFFEGIDEYLAVPHKATRVILVVEGAEATLAMRVVLFGGVVEVVNELTEP